MVSCQRMKQTVPGKILRAYDLGRVSRISVVSSGLIHQTYKIVAQKGTFILQRLHPVLATKEIASDFFAVTTHLAQEGFPAPHCVLTKTGLVLAHDGKHSWRMQTFIPGVTHRRLASPKEAREVGAMYAQLHRALDTMSYRFKSKLKLHETEKIYRLLAKTARAYRSKPHAHAVKPEIDFLLRELPRYFLPSDLPKRVIHGDPKTSNILFDTHGHAKAVVDLATCNQHTVLVDIGDALRSWCMKKGEDEHPTFRLDLFRAAWAGYARKADFLTARERRLVPRAVQCITLELAARFLTDYFTDDYFGWDPKRYASRREHNLARTRGQIGLFQDIRRQLPAMKKAVSDAH